MMRIGQGFDVHAYTEGNQIVLAGVTIPHKFAIKAHSDGDLVAHALSDALLGSLNLGDIGQHFPDTDNSFKHANSMGLLKQSYQKVTDLGWHLVNADMTIIAQSPKLTPYKQTMRENIAQVLNVDPNCISIKAKTAEKLGALGREEGIAAHVVVLLKQN